MAWTSGRTRVIIDPAARVVLADLLRQFIDGRITNDEFQDEIPRSRDLAVTEIGQLSWYLYDDNREYRLSGRDRLQPETVAEVERWICFLRTDLPYEWPTRPAWLSILCFLVVYPIDVVSMGRAGRMWFAWHKRRMDRLGDFELWPFSREVDYRAAAGADRGASSTLR